MAERNNTNKQKEDPSGINRTPKTPVPNVNTDNANTGNTVTVKNNDTKKIKTFVREI